MEEVQKISATFRDGILFPSSNLDLNEGDEVEILLKKNNLYESFSMASENSDVESLFSAQSEVLDKNERN